jgi:hypothetical protein
VAFRVFGLASLPKTDRLNSSFLKQKYQNQSRGSLAWLGRQTHKRAYFRKISENLPSFETTSFDWEEYRPIDFD